MTFKTLFCRKRAAFLLSLGLHGLLFGAIIYFSVKELEPQESESSPQTMRVMAYTPQAIEPPKPIEKPKPKPKPKPPKPKPLPKKVVEPVVKKIPIKKEIVEELVEEELEPEEIVEELIEIEEVVEAPEMVEEVAEQKTPEPPKKTDAEIAKEQAQLRAQQEQEFVGVNFSIIRDMALRNLVYPRVAKRMGWRGVVEIKLVIDSNGKLLEATVVKSSGKELLDRSALKAALALKDEVLPKPQSRSEIILPIAFSLR